MRKRSTKFGRHSNRMQTWDYSKAGYYFITVTVRGRKRWFGEIRNGQMYKTPLGEFVESSWCRTAELRPSMNIWLGEFVVMPDHFHAVLRIGPNEHNMSLCSSTVWSTPEDVLKELNHPKNAFGPQSNNLASIVRGFKASVTTEARKQGIPFEWDSRYHDSIVRSVGDLNFVRDYIRTNIQRWKGIKSL
ncbi:MAG: hypothetical protein RL040_1249 [Bacteroidota bacterium]